MERGIPAPRTCESHHPRGQGHKPMDDLFPEADETSNPPPMLHPTPHLSLVPIYLISIADLLVQTTRSLPGKHLSVGTFGLLVQQRNRIENWLSVKPGQSQVFSLGHSSTIPSVFLPTLSLSPSLPSLKCPSCSSFSIRLLPFVHVSSLFMSACSLLCLSASCIFMSSS